MKLLVPALAAGFASAAIAQTFPDTVIKQPDYTLTARAYIDAQNLPDSKYNPASRYNLHLETTPNARYKWDFTLPERPNSPLTGINGAYGAEDYKVVKQAMIRATLHQYDTYDEKVTFKNLDLTPVTASKNPASFQASEPRFLALSEPRSITTPSGITVTIPAQNGFQPEDSYAVYNGNTNALWMKIQVTPNTKKSELPDSPLVQKHHFPVSIKLETPEPNLMVYYEADNTFTGLKIGLPHLKTLTHIDELTLILRQRVDLQTVALTIPVPINKPDTLKATSSTGRAKQRETFVPVK